MCSGLHALAFSGAWAGSTQRLVERLAQGRLREVACDGGTYRWWRSLDGAELWLHYPFDPGPPRPAGDKGAARGMLAGLDAITPFHSGTSRLALEVDEVLSFDDEPAMEGAVVARLLSGDGRQRSGELVVGLAPFGLHDLAGPEAHATARLVCFATRVWAFADRAGYIAGTPGARLRRPGSVDAIDDEAVAAVSLDEFDAIAAPMLMTGRVVRSARLRNPIAEANYYWIELQTSYGTIDVVASPEAISGDISDGHVAQVFGTLLGRFDGVVPH